MTPKFQQHTSLLQNDTEAALKFTLNNSVATSKKSTLVNPQLNLSTLFTSGNRTLSYYMQLKDWVSQHQLQKSKSLEKLESKSSTTNCMQKYRNHASQYGLWEMNRLNKTFGSINCKISQRNNKHPCQFKIISSTNQ